MFMSTNKNYWPQLNFAEAKDTYATLHMFTQVIGKIKVALLPWVNHSWHVTLLVTPFGLTTGPITYKHIFFQLDFDFIEHQLKITTHEGDQRNIQLQHQSVARFYNEVFTHLNDLGIAVTINAIPNEIADAIPFYNNTAPAVYSQAHATALHKAFLHCADVMLQFRAEYKGKSSPVHFFWGSFDLAVSRFSGRSAPLHPGGIPNLPNRVVQEAYSQEVSSCGFWPGNDMVPFAAFYAYQYPEPAGYKEAHVQPADAYYHTGLSEFVLPYDKALATENPRETILQFLRSTFKAGADVVEWEKV